MGVVPGANAVPSAVRGCDHNAVGRVVLSDFHTRVRDPPGSTKTDGSIEPPRENWQARGAVEASVNGPWGEGDVAIEMHLAPSANPPPPPCST